MKSIKSNLIISTIILLVVSVLSITGTHFIATLKMNQRQLELMDTILKEKYDEKIREEVESLTSSLDGIIAMMDQGMLTKQQAELIAANTIRKAQYGESGYFWADDLSGNNIVMLGKEDVEGKSRLNLEDKKGIFIIQEFIKVATSEGAGYVDYYFPKPEETEAKQKRAYVKLYEPLGWVIGTGNYIDDIDTFVNNQKAELQSEFKQSMFVFGIMAILILAFGILVVYWISLSITRPLKNVTNAIECMSQLNIAYSQDLEKLTKKKDEIGQISLALIGFQQMLINMVKVWTLCQEHLIRQLKTWSLSRMTDRKPSLV